MSDLRTSTSDGYGLFHARGNDAARAHFSRATRGVLAYRLSSELLVSREAMRYRLQKLEVGDE